MRQKLVEADLVECVVGLGKNLFYNSPMESCVVVCCSQKPPERQNWVLFIDAVNEVAHERTMSYLRSHHQERIVDAYQAFSDETGFVKCATREEIAEQGFNLSIPRYVKRTVNNNMNGDNRSLGEHWTDWERDSRLFWQEMDDLLDMLDGLTADEGMNE